MHKLLDRIPITQIPTTELSWLQKLLSWLPLNKSQDVHDLSLPELFKEVSNLDIHKVWQEIQYFKLTQKIYEAFHNDKEQFVLFCTPGVFTQIVSSVLVIDSHILEEYTKQTEDRLPAVSALNLDNSDFIKQTLEQLINNPDIQNNSKLREIVKDLLVGGIFIEYPEKLTIPELNLLSLLHKIAFKEEIPEYEAYKKLIDIIPNSGFGQKYYEEIVRSEEQKSAVVISGDTPPSQMHEM